MSTDPSATEVADEVRAMAARHRLSQSVLAARANMSPSTLSRRLTGDSDFTVGELYRIAAVFGVSPTQLMPPQRSEASA